MRLTTGRAQGLDPSGLNTDGLGAYGDAHPPGSEVLTAAGIGEDGVKGFMEDSCLGS